MVIFTVSYKFAADINSIILHLFRFIPLGSHCSDGTHNVTELNSLEDQAIIISLVNQ
jgi:hypothetical protein